MARASLIAIVGAALLVTWQDSPVTSALHEIPAVVCAEAVAATVEARIDHLETAVRSIENGVSPASLPPAPSDARLAACPGG